MTGRQEGGSLLFPTQSQLYNPNNHFDAESNDSVNFSKMGNSSKICLYSARPSEAKIEGK